MFGSIIGDIVGSVSTPDHPGTRRIQPLFPPQARFTDHSVCTVGVADALLTGNDPARVLQTWCRRHGRGDRRSAGFSQWVAAEAPRPYGDHDAGAAARVSPAGLLGHSIEDALGRALRVTAITHDHPEGIRSALAVAAAIRWTCDGQTADTVRAGITAHFAYDLDARTEVGATGTRRPGRIETCVPRAIACALDATDFEDALRTACSVALEGEPLVAIVGGIAEARFGIPPAIAKIGWSRLPPELADVLVRLYESARRPSQGA